MRTTLTIEDDVAAELDELRRKHDVSLKEFVNDVLRQGLRAMDQPKKRKPFRTRTFSMGEPLINIDNIGEVLNYLDRVHCQ